MCIYRFSNMHDQQENLLPSVFSSVLSFKRQHCILRQPTLLRKFWYRRWFIMIFVPASSEQQFWQELCVWTSSSFVYWVIFLWYSEKCGSKVQPSAGLQHNHPSISVFYFRMSSFHGWGMSYSWTCPNCLEFLPVKCNN